MSDAEIICHFPALLEVVKAAKAVCGKEMEIDGITFRQQELIEPLRDALRKLEEQNG